MGISEIQKIIREYSKNLCFIKLENLKEIISTLRETIKIKPRRDQQPKQNHNKWGAWKSYK